MDSRIAALEKRICNLEAVFSAAMQRKRNDKYSKLIVEKKTVDDPAFKQWKKDNEEKYLELDKMFNDYQKHIQDEGSLPKSLNETVVE